MDRSEINGFRSPPISAASGGIKSPLLPNYSSQSVQDALIHLASIDLSELRNEAKVERCRATRDLSSCGRDVQHVLISCGHASLCAECSQRCDICPICRIPIPKNKNNLQLRLYYECKEAGLISSRGDERFEDIEDGENQLTADVQRLYSFFDIAMENNLVSLICHYVRDVCMDEAAVSSDPVIAFLLDEVVVKDWCKQAFKNIISELQHIYNLEVGEMQTKLSLLLKFSGQLAGISSVVEVLESSFKDDVSAQIHDLHHLQESILKTKQHLEIMVWCIRHRFLDNVRSRYAKLESWRVIVRERKAAATKRAWFDAINYSAESTNEEGSLFIEDALANLDIEQESMQGREDELKISSLHKDDDGSLSFFRSKIEGASGCYPFDNLRAAVDILFLNGSYDLVVAKKAIFLYYLFDRHWTTPDGNWRHIIDDFAATFSINRHSLLESLTFYLLDDHSEEALQEACQLLPEISCPATHPKIARVLLERQNPETALMVLRWSGRDGGSQLVSLSEAVTAVRVRVECALLTEAFTYQRMLCSKVREKKLKYGTNRDSFGDVKGETKTWEQWVEVLVTEICCLCIWRNLVDRMIELPWNSEEEKYIHKCLLDSASDDPSTSVGSLLVVFYLQRYRYAEAYQVNLKLQSFEQDFLSKNSFSEEKLSRMQSQSHWRTEFVDTCLELLPEVEQQLIKSGKSPVVATTGQEVERTAESGLNQVQVLKFITPSFSDSSAVPHMNPVMSSSSPVSDTPRPVNNANVEVGNHYSSILHERLFTKTDGPDRDFGSQIFKFDNISTSAIRGTSLMNATPLRETIDPSEALPISRENKFSDKILTEAEPNGFASQNTIFPYPHRLSANQVPTPSSNRGLSKESAPDSHSRLSGKRVHFDRDDGEWHTALSGEPMDICSSYGKKAIAMEDRYANANANGGLRWRSDETSDEEEDQSPERSTKGVAAFRTPVSGIRRSRFARR